MSRTDYDPIEDGGKVVKASAMEAAFRAYHQKYLTDKDAVMHYRGSVDVIDPQDAQVGETSLYGLLDDSTITLTIGDIYNVLSTGENFAYKGAEGIVDPDPEDYWDQFGVVVDLTGYATTSYVDGKFNTNMTVNGNITANGEVTAQETVIEDGQTTVVNHNLTDKLDADDYHAGYTWGEAANKFTWGTIRGDSSSSQATTTTNLGLTKPGLGDSLDVSVLNTNFDLLDANAKLRVSNGSGTAVSIDQLTFLDNANSAWKYLDEVRLYNGTDALYCKAGVTTGLLMQDNQIKVVAVTWNNGVPAVGALKGYIDSSGDYHIWDATSGADKTSLDTIRDSVSSFNLIKTRIDSSDDWNNIFTPGFYSVQGTAPLNGPPSVGSAYSDAIVFPDFNTQLIVTQDDGLCYRKRTGNPPTWQRWQSPLSGEYVSDLNLNTMDVRFVRYNDSTLNKPPNSWGCVLHCAHAQFAFGGSGDDYPIYVRRNGGSAWGNWIKKA